MWTAEYLSNTFFWKYLFWLLAIKTLWKLISIYFQGYSMLQNDKRKCVCQIWQKRMLACAVLVVLLEVLNYCRASSRCVKVTFPALILEEGPALCSLQQTNPVIGLHILPAIYLWLSNSSARAFVRHASPSVAALCARLSPVALNASPEGNYLGAESLCREKGQISPAYLSSPPRSWWGRKGGSLRKPSRKRRTINPSPNQFSTFAGQRAWRAERLSWGETTPFPIRLGRCSGFQGVWGAALFQNLSELTTWAALKRSFAQKWNYSGHSKPLLSFMDFLCVLPIQ